jgi:lipopolysaccharide transport system ATP-binding protein
MSSDSSLDPVLEVVGLSKAYEIYARPIDRLKQTLFAGRRSYFQSFDALADVSFSVRPGEAIAVLGRNGAGKSTLLQLLAGTLHPSAGSLAIRGRVAALLELGAGFNPELTGRRNVFINAAILGIKRSEIEERFDEIEAFAEIGAFIDRPVKTYSSGMLVRLAFAVHVLLEPDVLLVDEALAVGDAAFQIKCISAMKALLAKGTAVVLVTHGIETARSFCERAIWLHEGRVQAAGDVADVSSRYMRFLMESESVVEASRLEAKSGVIAAPEAASGPRIQLADRGDLVRWGSGEMRVEGFVFGEPSQDGSIPVEYGERVRLDVELRATQAINCENLSFGFSLRNSKGLDIITYTSFEAGARMPPLSEGQTLRLAYAFDMILSPGHYALVLAIERADGQARHYFDYVENAALIQASAHKLIFSAVLPEVEELERRRGPQSTD